LKELKFFSQSSGNMLADVKKRITAIVGNAEGAPKIGVAVSGGSDSMCLLHFCDKLSRGGKINCASTTQLVAVNIDHSTRLGESAKDSLFVAGFCKSHGIQLSAHVVDAPKFAKENNLNFEAAARVLRYGIFEKLINDGVVDIILTAHHALDQAETVLLHALRGCGRGGLSGIKDWPEKGIYRPLIMTSKAEIEEYLAVYKVPHVTDTSNFDTANDRNYLRHRVLPLLEERFCGCTERLGSLAENSAIDEDFFKSLIKDKDKNDTMVLEKSIFDKHNALIVRHILKIASRLDLERKHIDAIIKLGKQGKKDDRVSLPYKMTAWKSTQDAVIFLEEERYKKNRIIRGCEIKGINEKLADIRLFSKKKKQEVFIDNILLQYLYSGIIPVSAQLESHKGQYFDRSKLPLTAVLRTRKDGDILHKFDGTTVKLKKYLINNKIPQGLRDEIPLICDGDRVLFVAGYEVSKELAVGEASKNIGELKIRNYKCSENSIPN